MIMSQQTENRDPRYIFGATLTLLDEDFFNTAHPKRGPKRPCMSYTGTDNRHFQMRQRASRKADKRGDKTVHGIGHTLEDSGNWEGKVIS